jgi:HAD superfamily hydrolase (TIGR01509 family)
MTALESGVATGLETTAAAIGTGAAPSRWPPGPPALVIFDCDGVLVDSERLSHGVLHAMLVEMGARLSPQQTVERFIGASMATCVARVGTLLGGPPPDDFLTEFARRTRAAFAAELALVPGVEQVLAALAVPCCVASNGNRAKVDFTLGHTGLLARFAGRIFTADDVRHPKPAPDLFLHAARQMGADPGRTTVVEDTPTGITAAKAAGMRAIGFAAMTPAGRLQAAGADVVVHTMAEVQALLLAD